MTSYTLASELVFAYGVVERIRTMLSSGILMEFQTQNHFVNYDLEELKMFLSKLSDEFPYMYRRILGYSRLNMYPGPNMWAHLDTLRRVAYETEDMLHKGVTNHLEQKVKGRSEYHYLFNSSSARTRMLAELKSINNLLGDSDLKGNNLIVGNLESESEAKSAFISSTRNATCSSSQYYDGLWSSEDTFVVGRESEKKLLIDWIFDSNCQQHPNVICVYGDEGIGKTTLAKMIYNDVLQVSTGSFDLVLWALAPYMTDLKSNIAEIIRSFTNQSRFYLQRMDLERLKHTLYGILEAQKYLIVLDDYVVRKLAVWKELMKIFKVGLAGSTVIVTTKWKLGCTTKCLELQGLPENDCWSLFTRCVGFEEEYKSLRGIGRSLVNKCDRCPLAIKTLGRMLHRTHRYEHSWMQINESKIWTILRCAASASAFRISIEYMSCDLLQCLIVPLVLSANKVMSKEQLVHFWMAMGLLQSRDGNEDPRDIGNRFCDELMFRCAVQLFQSTDGNNMVLVHDHVSVLLDLIQKEVAFLPTDGSFPLNRRHLVWTRSQTSSLHQRYAAHGFTLDRVRTFLFQRYVGHVTKLFLKELISKLTHVRILLLDGSEFKELPETIGNLKLLRYLSLAGNHKLKMLPNSICNLVNLQTLDLSGCEQLRNLPIYMHRLVSLRHLFLSVELTHIPKKALMSWISLHHLKICNCPNLNSLSKEIAHLTALRVLQIHDCPLIASLPSNIARLTSLQELSIVNCGILDLTNWFGLEGLSGLQYLQFRGLPKLSKFPKGLHSAAGSLRHLVVNNCQNLTELPECHHEFKFLLEIVIENCPNMGALSKGMTAMTTLQVLKIVNCPKLIARCQTAVGEDWPLIHHVPNIQLLQHQVYQKRDISSLKEYTSSRPSHTSRLPVQLQCRGLPKWRELVAVTRLYRLSTFMSTIQEHVGRFILAHQLEEVVRPPFILCWLMAYLSLLSKILLLLPLFLLWNRDIYTTTLDELRWHAVLTCFLLSLMIHHIHPVFGSSQVRDATRRVYEMCWHGIQNLKAKAQGYRHFIKLELIERSGKQEIESYAKGMLLLLGEGCEFEKDRLIQLWMAVGFIELEPMEINGADYFEKFISQGYILHSHCDFLYKANIEKVKSDLDKNRTRSSYLRLESIGQRTDAAPAEILHVSVAGNDISHKMFETVRKFNRLKTLLFVSASISRLEQMPRDLFLCFECLLVLDLSRTDIKELPSSALKMIHLRYLDLSWTSIELLPETVSRFPRLQTLKLRGCSRLWKLPTETKRLVELRHLDFDVLGQLGAMPKRMGGLVSLRTLPAFIVSTQEGCTITELRDLNNLTGEFCIARLEHVQSADEAEMASLGTKKGLKKLDLRWSDFPLQDRSDQDVNDSVLENLCPHSDLQELQIRCYGGTNLPSWIKGDTFHKLTSITLFKCARVSVLPPMQNLPSLEHLGLVRLNSVTEMDVRVEKNHIAFPRLQRLIVDEMLDLNTWKEGEESDFPCLVELTIKHCLKLLELPSLVYLSSLKRLEISSCPEVQFVDDKQLSTQLEFLIVEDCPLIKENCLEEDGKSRDKIKHVKNVWIDQEGILEATDDDDDDHSELLDKDYSDINDD